MPGFVHFATFTRNYVSDVIRTFFQDQDFNFKTKTNILNFFRDQDWLLAVLCPAYRPHWGTWQYSLFPRHPGCPVSCTNQWA